MEDTNSETTSENDASTTAPDVATPPPINSVDATAHQPLVERAAARKLELEALLAKLPATEVTNRSEITFALATVETLLTGDLAHIPAVVAADLNRWLERTKHVGEFPSATPTPPPA
jgi:hypothetical protein